MTDFEHTDGIVRTAVRYQKTYPDWPKDQALDIAISEFDCWSQAEAVRAELMKRFEKEMASLYGGTRIAE